MITVAVIRGGSRYLAHHLRKNDYWAEGEKQVQGEWIGRAALMLGLAGAVDGKAFEALRQNRNPKTGDALTPLDAKRQVAFFDVQLSAPKDASVLALVGGDDRVRSAFIESVRTAADEMERFAAVRERRGDAKMTEAVRLTRNFVGALFFHDTSRDLDPQLHAHAVLANATWDEERGGWFALQPVEMIRASAYVRQVLYRELAGRLAQLGYETYGLTTNGFSIRGVEHLRERYSKRTRQVEGLVEDFARRKGRRPTQKEVKVLVRDSRADKLTEISTPAVRARQRAELDDGERRGLDALVGATRGRARQQVPSEGEPLAVLEAAFRHAYERSSVVREGDILAAALVLHPGFRRWRELRQALDAHPDAVRLAAEMTLRPIHREEAAAVRRVIDGRNTRRPLGDASTLPARLTGGQTAAARALLDSRDFVSVLIGDAGTGKTTVLSAVEDAHRAVSGRGFIPLAPTTRAREALAQAGFEQADTVQRFLVSQAIQAQAMGRLILVDEAGLLSAEQLDGLTRIAEAARARLLLVGDAKQHYSVQRGDALRSVVRLSDLPIVRLSEVLRQRRESDRQFSRLLASGEAEEAFRYAARRDLIRETGDDGRLFTEAAEHYAENRRQGVETLVVIPFWEEIERFNGQAREALRRRGLLGEAEVARVAVKPLTWTEEQKTHWEHYQPGDRLLFARDTRFFRRGSAAEVAKVLPDGLYVTGQEGRYAKITRKQRGAFDVGRPQELGVSAGDRLLFRGREDTQGFANGDFKEVAEVDPASNRIVFTDGKVLPPDFQAWTYGHALTSYRAQGSTAEASLLVLGEVAERALMRRQFYVGNTRYRGSHTIYVSRGEAILQRLALPDPGRELATEFIERLTMAERLAPRPIRNLRPELRQAWLQFAGEVQAERASERRKV